MQSERAASFRLSKKPLPPSSVGGKGKEDFWKSEPVAYPFLIPYYRSLFFMQY